MRIARQLAIWAIIFILASCARTPRPEALVYSQCLNVSLPANTEISLLSAYEGMGARRIRSNTFGGWDYVPGSTRILAAKSGPPQVFVISAYSTNNWDFAKVPVSRIKGVIVHGYYRQNIVNIPAGIPVKHGPSFTTRGRNDETHTIPSDEGCGYIRLASRFGHVGRAGEDLDRLVDWTQMTTGLKVARFRGEYKPSELNIDGPPSDPIKGFQHHPDDLRYRTGPQISPALEALIADGSVRLATQSEIDAWNRAATKNLKYPNLTPFLSYWLWPGWAYIATRPFDFPTGLSQRLHVFILPAEIPMPKGDRDYSYFYLMKGGYCVRDDECEYLKSRQADTAELW